MKTLAFTAPILPGKTEGVRAFGRELMGPRHQEMDRSRRALGQSRETIWIQQTPMGDIVVAYLEGQDSVQANRNFAASRDPLDLWFKEQAGSLTGVDFSQPLPEGSVEILLEYPASGGPGRMKSVAVAMPVLAGKTEDLRRWAREANGPRSAEQSDFFRRIGLTRARLYLQHTPMGDFAIQYSEGEDPASSYQLFAASTHPFDHWTREQLAPIHGIDFSQPFPALPELVCDYQAS